MSIQFQCCAALVREFYPRAVYVHYVRHSLNLALSHSYNLPVTRNCLETLKEIINLYRISPKHIAIFKQIVQERNPITGTKRTRLNKLHDTRWVEHLEAIMLFKEMFIIICKAMRDIQERSDSDSESSSKAYSSLSVIKRCSFVADMVTVNKVFSLSHNLSTFFLRSKPLTR